MLAKGITYSDFSETVSRTDMAGLLERYLSKEIRKKTIEKKKKIKIS